MKKKIFNLSFLLLAVFAIFIPILKIKAFIPLVLVSYDVSDTDISPNNDGIKDTVSIDIKYSEEVIADINILDAQGNKVREIYHSNAVTNPQSKVWDGKDNSDQIVSDGLYTIQILGIATANADNSISDTSKTISVNVPVPITLSSIAVTTPANKLEYVVGESLDISGLVITGTYSDESTKTEDITVFKISGFDSSIPVIGQILTISIGGQTATYTINIAESAPVHLDVRADVDVPSSCNATDTDGVIHNYPKGNSYLAICALETAIENGAISSAQFSNQFPSFGLFVTAFNNIVADPNSQYWAIYQNGNFANFGITSLPVVTGDIIVFQLHDFSDNNLGDQVTLNIHSTVVDTQGGGGGGPATPTFDIQKALVYLKSAQSSDGSFGDADLYTDWAGIAFGAMNVSGEPKAKILEYFNSHNKSSSLLTDNERHAMALLALGQNPYSFGGVNYIKAITDSFDGAQFGDVNLINDDIFALIPLKNSGYTASDDIITKDIAFLISKQSADGSWENSIDITAAAVQALKSFEAVTGVSDALTKTTNYLISAQGNDGGWNNVFSTSWTMQAMSALSASWIKGDFTPNNYLGAQQSSDSAALSASETLQNRIWATSYAIVGSSLKPWSAIMQSVEKPAEKNSSASCCGGRGFINPATLNNPLPNPPILNPLPTTPIVNANPAVINTNLIVANNPESQIKKISSTPKKAKTTEPLVAEIIPETNQEALTASAINALPDKTALPQATPIVLGVLTGFIFLYVVFKFLVV